eukprot:TRINITY_DN63446_c0_g2_i1.p3 TRINITY_DN63446_c0_g2~~TRINITY_DN63446_c0_g2_i1.p3  ORF type:complete len:115 (+),score=74.03 TRINITY_DN63446_c0_g2_i1:68-412(+)
MPYTVTAQEKDELLVTYAALILNDDKAPITDENINKLIKAAGADVAPFWPKLFADLLKDRDIGDLLLSGAGAVGAAPAGGAAAGGAAEEAAAEPEKEESEEEESDADMGFSLFD